MKPLENSLTDLFQVLKPREERIIRMRIMEYTYQEIGEQMCITKSRVGAIHKSASRKLRYPWYRRPFMDNLLLEERKWLCGTT